MCLPGWTLSLDCPLTVALYICFRVSAMHRSDSTSIDPCIILVPPISSRHTTHIHRVLIMFRAARTAATTARVARGYATQASEKALGEEFVATREAVKQHAAGGFT